MRPSCRLCEKPREPGGRQVAHVGARGRRATRAAGLRRDFDVTAATVERAWERLGAAIDRWAEELGPSGHLAGGEFSVAGLAFASLLATTVVPPAYPYPSRRRIPEIRDHLEARGVLGWIEHLYTRHRGEWTRP